MKFGTRAGFCALLLGILLAFSVPSARAGGIPTFPGMISPLPDNGSYIQVGVWYPAVQGTVVTVSQRRGQATWFVPQCVLQSQPAGNLPLYDLQVDSSTFRFGQLIPISTTYTGFVTVNGGTGPNSWTAAGPMVAAGSPVAHDHLEAHINLAGAPSGWYTVTFTVFYYLAGSHSPAPTIAKYVEKIQIISGN